MNKKDAKAALGNSRTSRAVSGIIWSAEAWASQPHLAPPPRKQRSKTQRKKKRRA